MAIIRALIATPLALCLLAPALSAQERSAGAKPPQELERLIFIELFLGANWPTGDTNVFFDPSFLAGGRAEVVVGPIVRAGVELSFHSFDTEFGTAADNQAVIALSLFGRVNAVWGPYRPFGLAGIGFYDSKRADGSHILDPGFQLGGGAEIPVSEHVSVQAGTALHFVARGDGEDELTWVEGYFGFIFRQP